MLQCIALMRTGALPMVPDGNRCHAQSQAKKAPGAFGYLPGGPEDSRTTRCGTTVVAAIAGTSDRPAIFATSFSAALRPMLRLGGRLLGGGGHSREASGVSSKPMTVSSSGIFTPRRYAVR